MWTNWRNANYEYLANELRALAGLKFYLVDLGAGSQKFKDLTKFFTTTTVDINPPADVVADLTKKFPFEDESFDIAFASNVLEHIFNPQHFLDECYRILKKGGMLIGTIPFMAKVHAEPDYHRYTPATLKHLLKYAALPNHEITSLGNPRDVFLTSRNQYFKLLKGHRFLKKIYNKLPTPLAEQSDKFTEGYGFRAIK